MPKLRKAGGSLLSLREAHNHPADPRTKIQLIAEGGEREGLRGLASEAEELGGQISVGSNVSRFGKPKILMRLIWRGASRLHTADALVAGCV